jgi:3-phosphoglycerate kinase
VAGLAFERELRTLEVKLGEPRLRPSLALLGGEVSKDKLLLAEEIARRSDRTFVAGQLAFPFLIARELLLSSAAVTEEMVAIAQRMMAEARADKRVINTPADFTVVDKKTFERLSRGEPVPPAPPLLNVAENEIEPDQIIADIGTVTRWSWSDWFGPSRTIFWHGPVGSVKAADSWRRKLPIEPGHPCMAPSSAARAWLGRFAASGFPPNASGILPMPAGLRSIIAPVIPSPPSMF